MKRETLSGFMWFLVNYYELGMWKFGVWLSEMIIPCDNAS